MRDAGLLLAILVLAVSVEFHPIADADVATGAPASSALAAEAATIPDPEPAAPAPAVTAVDEGPTCETEEREVFVYDPGEAARKAGSAVRTLRVVFCPST